LPLFCICRGFQELNVVLGGTLETELQTIEGRLDHRAPDHDDVNVRYAPAHAINIRPGGMLEKILGKREAMVNSIHRQGIKRLAPGLAVEATAPDGIIEAVSVRDARSFAFGTQWHPEFRAMDNPDSVKLFSAFGDAVRAYAQSRGLTAWQIALKRSGAAYAAPPRSPLSGNMTSDDKIAGVEVGHGEAEDLQFGTARKVDFDRSSRI
jgi:putative glutamine amidotransferase